MGRLILIPAIILITYTTLSSQGEEIILNNPSFEDVPHQGGDEFDPGIRGWYDCGQIQFPGESPPDIHHQQEFWEVSNNSNHGETYLGLVVRDNDSWESVSQRLTSPLYAGSCYEISLYLAQSPKYMSGSRDMVNRYGATPTVNYNEPTVLRIWAGTGVCERQDIIAESRPINHNSWEKYTFKLEPTRNFQYITFEAFYEVPVLLPYNGHVLLDNISSIKEIPCDDELAVVKTPEPQKQAPKPQKKKPTPKPKPRDTGTALASAAPTVVYTPPPAKKEPKKVSGLGFKEIKKGQVIRIENLYFPMNEAVIQKESYTELNKLFKFLDSNSGVVVEIGGHTNTVPPQDYCMRLSKSRAKAVTDYLIEKGIPEHRIKYKGYGKSNPVIKDDRYDMAARQKNQRVEIKILDLGA